MGSFTERDQRILRLVRDQKFITAEQVKHEFGGGYQMSAVYRRLRVLVRNGLLRSETVLTHNKKLYMITREWWGDGYTEQHGYIPFFNRPRVHQIEHDLKVTEVRLAMMRLYPRGVWIPERALLSYRKYPLLGRVDNGPVSDGLLEDIDGARIFIEVECSNKGEERTRETMQSWMDFKDSSLTLYVATEEYVYKQLYKVLRTLSPGRNPNQVGIIRYEDLLHPKGDITIRTYKGECKLITGNESKGVDTHADRY